MSIYRQFGVEPVINASGSVTRLGGAGMPQQVLDAFRDAAAESVSLEQLQAAASRRIARHTGTESGLVTAGSAAALTLGASAIMTGHDLGRMERLPDSSGFPNEFLIAREQRNGYDHAVRAAGAKLIDVGFNEIVSNAGVRRTEVWEYESAITGNTAGIVYVYAHNARPQLGELVEMAHNHNLPVLVDAAGELPPRSNLREIPSTGADLTAFSGGKAIRGPQSTGILSGRRDLISSAALQMLDMDDHWEIWEPPEDLIDRSALDGIPRHGIGRAMKVSREEIVALLTALDLFMSGNYNENLGHYQRHLETISDALAGSKAVCHLVDPAEPDRWPILHVHVDELANGKSALEVCRDLRRGSPPIYVGHGRLHAGILQINPTALDDRQASVIADRLRDLLS